MAKAYSYIRMSTLAQLHGDSLRRQIDLSDKYAADHGLELVRDFQLQDIGVSAFKGVNASAGALGRFIQAVADGRVPIGSYLLVESLDRLSREKVAAAMRQFLEITESGINVVTLADGVLYPAKSTDFVQLIMSLMIMSRANEESEMKSRRVSAAWQNKRNNAAGAKLTRKAPAWLTFDSASGTFFCADSSAELLKDLFKKCVDGWGSNALTRHLNSTGAPIFGKPGTWQESYVTKVLQSRAVLGEFQPHKMINGRRVPDGNPIADYFPRLIEDLLFYQAQAARRARQTGAAGRKGAGFSNLFTNIATCERCGRSMRYINKGVGPKGGKYLRCSGALLGLGCSAGSWRYTNFESSFLLFATELDLASIVGAAEHEKEASKLAAELTGEEEKLRQLELMRERIYHLYLSSGTEFLAGKLADIEGNIAKAQSQICNLKAGALPQVRSPESASEALARIELLRTVQNNDAEEQRVRLNAKLREMVVSLTLSPDGYRPFAALARMFLQEELSEHQDRWAGMIADLEVDFGAQPTTTGPSFQVEFADGTIRRVVVDPQQPTRYVVSSVINRKTGYVDAVGWSAPIPTLGDCSTRLNLEN